MKVLNYSCVTIVKEAIYSDEESVDVISDDAGILCLHLHHTTLLDLNENLFMGSMKLNKMSGQHATYRI